MVMRESNKNEWVCDDGERRLDRLGKKCAHPCVYKAISIGLYKIKKGAALLQMDDEKLKQHGVLLKPARVALLMKINGLKLKDSSNTDQKVCAYCFSTD